jgi:hypothetical protein
MIQLVTFHNDHRDCGRSEVIAAYHKQSLDFSKLTGGGAVSQAKEQVQTPVQID